MDAPTRVLHWLLALSFLGAYVTADGERWRLVHVMLGYTMAGLLVARLLWGVWGPRPARLSMLWRKLQGLPAWLKAAASGRTDWRQGQNLLLAATVALLLALIAPLTLSGLGVYQEWVGGDWLETVHAWLGDGLLVLVLAHVVAVLALSVLRQRNLVAPMLTGRTAGAGPDLVKRPFAGVAALLLAVVLAFWAWQWQAAPTPLTGDARAAQSQHDDDD
ncbi:cytochrome b/b6 domain-containing protein [Ottowia testudinis]|uniref:cytochrome b/b6 domain-containing protein n=1 Tax=Ottowia testudinis TaxID=2816950 RepID=UPI001FB11A81|nr:cytochrome b/b6 domain-containing protein [Ottowia testudinis]